MAAPRPEAETPEDVSAAVQTEADGTRRIELAVGGLHCAACVWRIESALARQPGVRAARINVGTRRLTLRWSGAAETANTLTALVARLGYRAVPFTAAAAERGDHDEERALLRAIAVAGFAFANVMLLSVAVWSGHTQGMGPATRDLLHWVSALIALPALAYAGQPFFRSAWAALRQGGTNMDVPISVGVTLAAVASLIEVGQSGTHAYFDSAITLVFFLLIGRFLDRRMRGRARSAAAHLLSLGAAPVTVLDADGHRRALPPRAVPPGAAVLVAAGERIGVDGRVEEGASEVDQSFVTGEQAPEAVVPGAPVLAGMINLTAPLRLSVTATGDGTVLAGIARLVEAAEQGRSRHLALADRVARRYAPAVHTVALATVLGWVALGGMAWGEALLIGITVLIITCPCALALAIPAVQVAAVGRLMREGIILKSATALERLAAADTVVFDKTGTLTRAEPALVHPVDAGALRIAAGLAAASRHPLSRALARAMPEAPRCAEVREHPGEGLSCLTPAGEIRLGSRRFAGVAEEGRPVEGPALWLARPGHRPVRFAFANDLRPDAEEVAAGLAQGGYRLAILSGDRAAVVAPLAARLGIPDWQAEQDPAAKLQALIARRAAGQRVAMVGDGLNDAPALAAALVSISPASATDVAQAAADAVFQGERLAPVARLLAAAQAADRLARQNLAFALAYNAVAVPLAIAGLVTPLIAAVAMSSSSIVVIANALRLGRMRL